jgi:fructose-1,6-bisphosphatase II
MSNAIAVVALAERGALYSAPPGVFYMEKLAVGPEAADVVDIRKSVAENLAAVAQAKGMEIRNLTVIILDRPRHEELVKEVRATGARIKFITDGDVAGALLAVRGEGADILLGTGGAPEAVITACAIRCMGGALQCRLWPRNDEERQQGIANGVDFDRVLHIEDLARGDNLFFSATGITDGELLDGVRFTGRYATTQSLVMRSRTGTIRTITSRHSLNKLRDNLNITVD